MTIEELYKKLRPSKTHDTLGQILADGVSVNLSDLFTALIRDAARCNSYSSDVYYDLCTIEREIKDYRAGQDFTPIFVGFRRHGVDGNSFILSRLENDLRGNVYSLSREYFALYSVMLVPEDDCANWVRLVWNEYWM